MSTPTRPCFGLRDVLGMSGTKFGCGVALCGACTVQVDGVPTRSCVTPIGGIGDKAITTIEAVGKTPQGKALQQAWLDGEVVQCGYCQSGQIMAAAALLAKIPAPTDPDIDQGMSGNICHCGTYPRISTPQAFSQSCANVLDLDLMVGLLPEHFSILSTNDQAMILEAQFLDRLRRLGRSCVDVL